MIGVKYGQEEFGWKTKEGRGAYGVGAWKEIMKEANWCWENIKFKAQGRQAIFRGGRVLGKEGAREVWGEAAYNGLFVINACDFPHRGVWGEQGFPLFALATSKEAWVNEVWTVAGERGGSWSPCFNRPFNDWELEEVERLFCCLDGKKVSVDEEDRVRWMDSKDGVFSRLHGEESNLGPFQRRVGLWLIDAFCAKCVSSRLITSSFIVKNKGSVDAAPFFIWSILGVSFFSKGTLLGGGTLLWVRRGRWCGKWDRYACFGSFGRQGIELLLKIACCPSKG
ncbi:hypothetical protein CK203_092202 [Vitis vinifera]|uniref:Uncharacterized protein n=1 Tax=Vitis vinifera TaxID=29760 RepID=A0A438F285_VITVI|nr:hypothetical protein CK203_092202 [Vitis vinifera]